MSKSDHPGLSWVKAGLKWLGLSAAAGALAGTASAVFLRMLDGVTSVRETHLWMIALLPLAGFAAGWVYHAAGKQAERGNHLLIDEIHDPKQVVPLRMAPLVLFGTLATHLFGGSAGREGTAVQMGGSLADQLTRLLKLSSEDRRTLLMAGISAGFGSIFGAPLAGAVFGLEVLVIRPLRLKAFLPCFAASVIANAVAAAWGIHHVVYAAGTIPAVSAKTAGCVAAAGVVFGLTGMLFVHLTHALQQAFKKYIAYAPLRPAIGGIFIVAAVGAMASTRFIGLGIPLIVESFTRQIPPTDFLSKIFFTAVTLGSGFKGGEVTPLFAIGAALGNALSRVLVLPVPFLAACGFAAVFAGAANIPLTCTILAMEVFGPQIGVFAAIACGVSFVCSGHTGIYTRRPKDSQLKQNQ